MRLTLAFLVAFFATTGVARSQAPAQPPAAPAQPSASAGQVQQPGQPLKLPATICGLEVPAPVAPAPPGTPTVVAGILPCFEKQGGLAVVDPET